MRTRNVRSQVPDTEALLSHLGLEHRRSPAERTLVGLGLFAGGVVAGLGVAWLAGRGPGERRGRSGRKREPPVHDRPG